MFLKNGLIAAVMSAVAFTAAPVLADDYPSDTITIIVPSRPGGSIDRVARSVQKYLGDALGTAVNVENVPGAGSKIGVSKFTEAAPDGHTLLVHFSPGIVQVKLDDPDLAGLGEMAVINAPWSDPGILVGQPGRWETLADFVAEAREKPGTITFGSSSPQALGSMLAFNLFDQLGLDIKVVPYDGGGETRSAFLGGLVDLTAAGAGGALRIKDQSTPLALFWNEPVAGWDDAPLIADALEGLDAKPVAGAAVRFLATHKAFAENNPDGFAKLAAALEQVSQNPDYIANAKETKVGADWLGPEAAAELVNAQALEFEPILRK
ncbi:tripartite tricarboxylate transporter substrate binding protein [Roseibium sp. MMSF_3544]|uniref:Bug family tripartite tricarboxylate transporter substrate binding protein n=1 Tax=unclassified Roseibium TaxID=2629323 RepID=UPI00273E769C|nr:tripartite tricarboxylate transporter substrate-binding protein [Roseibium sp. MMSF_3544]